MPSGSVRVVVGRPQGAMTRIKVADQRFSLKQWFAGGAQSRWLRKPWLWSLLFKVFRGCCNCMDPPQPQTQALYKGGEEREPGFEAGSATVRWDT